MISKNRDTALEGLSPKRIEQIIEKDTEFNCHKCGSPKTKVCLVCHLNDEIEINKETAEELLIVLNHQFIPHEYTLVHAFIKRCWELSGKK